MYKKFKSQGKTTFYNKKSFDCNHSHFRKEEEGYKGRGGTKGKEAGRREGGREGKVSEVSQFYPLKEKEQSTAEELALISP